MADCRACVVVFVCLDRFPPSDFTYPTGWRALRSTNRSQGEDKALEDVVRYATATSMHCLSGIADTTGRRGKLWSES